MSVERQYDHPLVDHAVVIGSGIAGLLAAQVLAHYAGRVTIIDRDQLPDQPAFRAGIPQAHHAHTLLPFGQMLLEQQFPHLVDELLLEGAITIDDENEVAYYDQQGVWRKPEARRSRASVACSRPLLEHHLYRRITALPQVTVMQGYQVLHLLVDEARAAIAGVALRNLSEPGSQPIYLEAGLVVDASGRNSRAPQWLESLGYQPPEEWTINAHAGYSSRIYRVPAGAQRSWKKLYISPTPPSGSRGGVITPLEGDRWHVTLIGLAGDLPPTDEDGFLEFARSLPVPDLYEAISTAEPISRISGYRRTENRVRRYEDLPSYLEGFLVMGDAVFTMNPVYALGMTAAASGSRVLDMVLCRQVQSGSMVGLAESFQKGLAHDMVRLWRQAVENEWHWPLTEVEDNSEELVRRKS